MVHRPPDYFFVARIERGRRNHERDLFTASESGCRNACGRGAEHFFATGHAQDKPIRIGLVTFLSGPAAGPFGVPAKIAAEAIVDSLNAGKVPAPYNAKGFAGTPLELTIIDEAGGATKQVTELRNQVERQEHRLDQVRDEARQVVIARTPT
ncbi:MAG: hypothetical protein ACREVW_04520 [Burkholderiales bacterium]